MSDNTIEIPLTKGYAAIVDAEDADLAQRRWCALVQKTGNVYAKRAMGFKAKHKTLLLHRVISERMLNRILSKDEQIDHVDGNTLNNTRENLRVANHTQNMRNSKKRKNNTSGYKGVNYFDGRWRAQIQVDKQRITIGMYDTPEEAYQAYCDAAIQYHGIFARFE